MSEPPSPYTIEYTQTALDQVHAIAAYATKVGQINTFARIVQAALQKLETDPHGWGDPEFRAKTVDAVACHALIPPVAFQYVIYESVRGIVVRTVKLYRDFA